MRTMTRTPALAALLLLTLAGCAANEATPSAIPSPTPSPRLTPSAILATPTALPMPTTQPTPTRASPFGYGDRVRVTQHGADLAVRVTPFVTAPMVAGYVRPDETSGDWRLATQELRLDAGQAVRLGVGPICIAELCWYQVFSGDDLLGWDADHDGLVADAEHGWIASGDAEGSYLELSRPVPKPVVSESGRASTASAPFVIDQDGVGLWATWALATDGLAPCDLSVTLQPGNLAFVAESLEGAFTEGASLTQMIAPGEYRLHVSASVSGSPDAECPWAVALGRTDPGNVP